MSANSSRVLEFIDSEELAKLTMDIVSIPSPVGGERGLAEYLGRRWKALGMQVEFQWVEDNRPNVVGVWPGSGGGPTLMYLGHLDSTWAGDEEGIRDLGPAYQPKAFRDGDWIYGLGAYNMKGSFASSIHAVEAIVQAKIQLPGDLIIAGVVGETCNTQVDKYQGARYRGSGFGCDFLVNAGVSADLCVVPESTSFRVSVASGGYVYFLVRTLGNPGHTYHRGRMDADVKPGVDAFRKMLKVIEAIDQWSPKYRASHTYMGEPIGAVAIVAIDGGLPFHPTKIPPFCKLFVEVDTAPGQHPLDVIKEFEDVVYGLRPTDPELSVEVKVIQTLVGAEVSPESYVVRALTNAYKQVRGQSPQVTFDNWFSDTTTLTRHGIPAVCFGPGGRSREGGSGYYPRSGEHCYLPDLVEGARVYAQMALDACSQRRESVVAERGKNGGTVVL